MDLVPPSKSVSSETNTVTMMCLCVFCVYVCACMCVVCLCMCIYACRLRSALGIPHSCSAFYFERSLAEPRTPPAQLDQQASKRCGNLPVCLPGIRVVGTSHCAADPSWALHALDQALYRLSCLSSPGIWCALFFPFAIRNCSFGNRGSIVVYILFFRSSKWGS